MPGGVAAGAGVSIPGCPNDSHRICGYHHSPDFVAGRSPGSRRHDGEPDRHSSAGQAESVRSLWLQIHGLRYADQASVQINTSAWIPLNNNTVAIAEPGRTYGGIGGGFATLVMTLPLPDGTVAERRKHNPFSVQSHRRSRQQLSRPGMELSNRRGKEDSPGQKVLWRMHRKAGRRHYPTQLRFRQGESSGTPLSWRPAAFPIVQGFRRAVPTAMRRMGAT